jgi:hypothetical protein
MDVDLGREFVLLPGLLSRVLTVAGTIITSFPRRWGKNKPDPSAVHKSIRARLRSAREDEIRTVFDLALIIVDQCSRVFFDRSKSIDRAPNLVDIFADSIRGVVSPLPAPPHF